MQTTTGRLALAVAVLAAGPLFVQGSAAAGPKGGLSGPPVTVEVAVAPDTISAGSDAEITVRVAPNPGIKLNKYPKIKVSVPEVAGLVSHAEAAIGNDAPPPPDQMEGNYFKTVEPVRLKLRIDNAASKGKHEIDARLSYFYCVSASGYCAPAKEPLRIPVTVR